ncbi:MAG: nitroreductase family protein [Lachnospirales bacterium]
MDFNKLIQDRRSIRQYDETKKVTKDMINEIIYAASQAPSWKNSQTGRYYCVLSEENIGKFAEECLPEFNQNNSKGAALIVATFVHNRSGYNKDGTPCNELGNMWGSYDLGLQNENLILKAKDMGLDTLIMGIRDSEKIRELLDIPTSETIVSVIAIGYGEIKANKPERKSVEDIVKYY